MPSIRSFRDVLWIFNQRQRIIYTELQSRELRRISEIVVWRKGIVLYLCKYQPLSASNKLWKKCCVRHIVGMWLIVIWKYCFKSHPKHLPFRNTYAYNVCQAYTKLLQSRSNISHLKIAIRYSRKALASNLRTSPVRREILI